MCYYSYTIILGFPYPYPDQSCSPGGPVPQTTHLGPEPIPLIVMVIFIETGSSLLLNPKIVASFGRFRLFCLGCLLSKTYFELILKMEAVLFVEPKRKNTFR